MKVKLKITHEEGDLAWLINSCFRIKRKRWLFYFTIKTFRYGPLVYDENGISRSEISEEEAYQKATKYIDNYCAIQQAAKDKKRADKAAEKAEAIRYKKWTKEIKYQRSCECD